MGLMIKKKICVLTTNRADFGLLCKLMKEISESYEFTLQVIVSGSHLEKKFGETYTEILANEIKIDVKVPLLLEDDTSVGMSLACSRGLSQFANAFNFLNPDLLVVLGDRFEVLTAVIPAAFNRIPICHIHGGEVTQGSLDEAVRHSLTKFSHLHFTACLEYKNRVIQLGEHPDTVFNVGGMGVDAIKSIELLSKKELEEDLNLIFKDKNLLITFHPVTLEPNESYKQIKELLAALGGRLDTTLIFTMPNPDMENQVIFDLIKEFVGKNKNAHAFTSLGQRRYFSCINYVDAVVGNSSSGLTEVPTFKKATVNIGSRQNGRIRAKSVIDCMPNEVDIRASLDKLYRPEFQLILEKTNNPYGDGGASRKILKILRKINFNSLLKKSFYDVNLHEINK
jgi:GDP/UDP-N,N'-diacetylbacillosamine 2-epimerase (hydrolysing)